VKGRYRAEAMCSALVLVTGGKNESPGLHLSVNQGANLLTIIRALIELVHPKKRSSQCRRPCTFEASEGILYVN